MKIGGRETELLLLFTSSLLLSSGDSTICNDLGDSKGGSPAKQNSTLIKTS